MHLQEIFHQRVNGEIYADTNSSMVISFLKADFGASMV